MINEFYDEDWRVINQCVSIVLALRSLIQLHLIRFLQKIDFEEVCFSKPGACNNTFLSREIFYWNRVCFLLCLWTVCFVLFFFFFFCLLCSGTWVKSFLWELSFKVTFKERISVKVVLALRMLTETRGEYITGIQRKILEKFLKIYISLSWEVKKIKNLELSGETRWNLDFFCPI